MSILSSLFIILNDLFRLKLYFYLQDIKKELLDEGSDSESGSGDSDSDSDSES